MVQDVISTEIYHAVARQIARSTGQSFQPTECRSVGGGCINQTVVLDDGRRSYFVKLNQARMAPLFDAEAEGLDAIRTSGTIRAPKPITAGVSGEHSWLVLEHLTLRRGQSHAARQLGTALAAMHRRTVGEFGWHRDNAIGSTPQINDQSANWVEFWTEHRLGYQLRLARRNAVSRTLLQQGEHLLGELHTLLAGHSPAASLLHGDLWCGNAASDEHGAPVVFDPAVYYGDREADIAMTELFGGFGSDFYAAYQDRWPLDDGYPVRRDLYNLYHVLNHLNLFGGSYEAQASRLMERLLGETG